MAAAQDPGEQAGAAWPVEAGPLSGLSQVVGSPLPAAALDRTDLRLLALLAADSRTSQRKLGRELNMSAPAVGVRIARLERAGVIQGYSVRVDWAAGGMDLLARIRLRDHSHLKALMFEQVWQIPGVQRTETFLTLVEMPGKEFTRLLIEQQERLDSEDSGEA